MKRYVRANKKSDYADAPYVDIKKTYYLLATFSDPACTNCIATYRSNWYSDCESMQREDERICQRDGSVSYYKIYTVRPRDEEPDLNPFFS